MKIISPQWIDKVERTADAKNRGSVFRACLAFQRSCEDNHLGELIIELGYGYVMGRKTLHHLDQICKDHATGAKGEFKEAIAALKNAVEMQEPQKPITTLDSREDLWIRLNRLID